MAGVNGATISIFSQFSSATAQTSAMDGVAKTITKADDFQLFPFNGIEA